MRIIVNVEPDLFEKLQSRKLRLGIPMSWSINVALKRYLRVLKEDEETQ